MEHCVALLRQWLPEYPAEQPLFPKLSRRKGYVDLPPDLVPLRMREFRVSGSSVFWWMKRSGILQNTAGRERGRGLVIESTMRSPVVVVKTPTVNHPESVFKAEEQLPVE